MYSVCEEMLEGMELRPTHIYFLRKEQSGNESGMTSVERRQLSEPFFILTGNPDIWNRIKRKFAAQKHKAGPECPLCGL